MRVFSCLTRSAIQRDKLTETWALTNMLTGRQSETIEMHGQRIITYHVSTMYILTMYQPCIVWRVVVSVKFSLLIPK